MAESCGLCAFSDQRVQATAQRSTWCGKGSREAESQDMRCYTRVKLKKISLARSPRRAVNVKNAQQRYFGEESVSSPDQWAFRHGARRRHHCRDYRPALAGG